MKIIKMGKDPQTNEIQETCHWCKTVFSYEKSDVKPDNRDGDYVVCPCCGRFIAAKSFLPNPFKQ
jgi:hypothetical protein